MINAKINPPKVSILIPVFNRKDYIAECIQSALDQNFADFEVVLVDNASDDGTWEICQQFAASDHRVRIFRNQINIGPVRNWIRCVQEAEGEFSKMLFSDDSLEPNCLSEMVPKLEDPDIGLVYCAARIGKSKDESIIAYDKSHSSRLSSNKFLTYVLSGKAPVSPGAVLIRTIDFLKNLHATFPTSTPRQFDRNGAGPDVMIMLLTSNDYSFVANVNKSLVYFRAHPGSFTVQNTNNEVMKGYHSAISLFLIHHCSYKEWLKYSAKSWLQVMRSSRSWRRPTDHLIEFEGRGDIKEVMLLIYLSILHGFGYLIRRTFAFVLTMKSIF